jgi:inorganic pyrophosphatase
LAALGCIAAAYITLPERLFGFVSVDRAPLHAWICTVIGLVAGLIIGLLNDSSTNYSCDCVKDIAKEQDAGSLHYVSHGLALGSASTIVPLVLIAVGAFITFTLLGAFGIALAALGLLSTIAIVLAVDTFGPIAGNAAGIVEMCNLAENVRGSADNLDSAGQNTSSIGKGYAIAGAAFVALALFGAYLMVAGNFGNAFPISFVSISTPIILAGLLVGSILPHAFIANINSAVNKSKDKLVNEVN